MNFFIGILFIAVTLVVLAVIESSFPEVNVRLTEFALISLAANFGYRLATGNYIGALVVAIVAVIVVLCYREVNGVWPFQGGKLK